MQQILLTPIEEGNPNKIKAIKLIRDVTGLDLTAAKALAEDGGELINTIDENQAQSIVKQFSDLGIEVSYEGSLADSTPKSKNSSSYPNLITLGREDLISALRYIQDILHDLAKKSLELDHILEDLDRKIETEKKNEKAILSKLNDQQKKKRKTITIAVAALFFLIGIINDGFSAFGSCLIAAAGMAGVTYLVTTIVMHSFASTKPDPAYAEEAKQYHLEHVWPLEKQRREIKSEFQAQVNWDEVNWASNALSEEYVDYSILSSFISYLQSGRADNLKEAINLYEEEQHRNRMENMQRATLDAAERTANSAESAAKSAASTARAAAVSARANIESAANLRSIRKNMRR